MPNNNDQVCFITVLFNCPVDAFALEVKAKLQEALADVDDAKIDLRLGVKSSGGPMPRG